MRKVVLVFVALAAVVAGAAVFVVLPSDGGVDSASSKKLNALSSTSSTVRTFLDIEGRSLPAIVVAHGEPVSVVQTMSQADMPSSKHLTSVDYPDVVVDVPASNWSSVAPWVAETWNGVAAPKTMSLTDTDGYGKVLRRIDFEGVAVVGVRVPDLDAASNDQLRFRLTLRPSAARVHLADGSGYTAPAATRQQSLLTSGFRLMFAGQVLNAAKVEAFDATSALQAPPEEGEYRLATKTMSVTSFPNIRVVVPASHAADLRRRYVDTLTRGDEIPREEGRLEFMAADGTPSGLAIDLNQCGIMRLDTIPASGDQVAKVLAEFFCNRMAFQAPRP